MPASMCILYPKWITWLPHPYVKKDTCPPTLSVCHGLPNLEITIYEICLKIINNLRWHLHSDQTETMNKLHMIQCGKILIRKLDNKTKDAVCHTRA
jgi:hypothetical protein